jgi:hypothetical protein
MLLTGRFAEARGAERVEQVRTARTACLSGDYARGVAILSELFVDTEDPTFIYNQGRCFQQNQRYGEAIGRFQEYLRIGRELTKRARDDAEQQIADCEHLLAKQNGQPAAAATQASAASTTPAVPVASASTSSNVASEPGAASAPGPTQLPGVRETSEPPVGATASHLRVAGVVSASVGGAALITGMVLNLKANSIASDMGKPNGYTDDKASQRQTMERLSWAGYGVGAASVLAGAILYYLGGRSDGANSTAVAITSSFTPGQTSVVVKGCF